MMNTHLIAPDLRQRMDTLAAQQAARATAQANDVRYAQHQVVGRLARPAEARMCLGGAWVVVLEMRHLRPGSPPIVATHQHGSGEAARAAAHSQAARLRQGAAVRVYCAGIGLHRTQANEAAIELRGVDSVQLIQE